MAEIIGAGSGARGLGIPVSGGRPPRRAKVTARAQVFTRTVKALSRGRRLAATFFLSPGARPAAAGQEGTARRGGRQGGLAGQEGSALAAGGLLCTQVALRGAGGSERSNCVNAPSRFIVCPLFIIAPARACHTPALARATPTASAAIAEGTAGGGATCVKGPTSAYRAPPGVPAIIRARATAAPLAFLGARPSTTPAGPAPVGRHNALRRAARTRGGIRCCCPDRGGPCIAYGGPLSAPKGGGA